jgi:hypothetical protein
VVNTFSRGLLANLGLAYSLKLAFEDPPIFRTVLLVAASHYVMQAGGLHDYEKAYHFHMAETIHDLKELVKELDSSKQSIARIARLVATLCMVEVSGYFVFSCLELSGHHLSTHPANILSPQTRIGNFTAAEAHLEGLLTLLDMLDSYALSGDVIGIHDEIDYLENCLSL